MVNIKPGGSIDMTELSKQNGLSPLENLKAILEILAVKMQVTGKEQTIIATFRETK